MTPAAPPYDGDAYQPTGAMSDAERDWSRRLYRPQHAVLSWQLAGRDRAGDLVATCTLSCEAGSGLVRDCYATFTPHGLVYRESRRSRTDEESRQGMPPAST